MSSVVTVGNLDQKCYDFLQSVLVSNLERKDYELVTIDPNETAIKALKILTDNKISAAPIFDVKNQKIIGTISTMDLLVWIVRTYALAKDEKSTDLDPEQIKLESKTTVREVSHYGLDPFWPITESESALSLINNFLRWKVHRVPVVQEDRHISGSVSQSDLLRYINENQTSLEFVLQKNLKELKLEKGDVVSVRDTESVIKALGTIAETQFTGLAVVNSSGVLVGNISASDMKGITLDNFQQLNTPLKEFLQNKELVTVKQGATLREVIAKMAEKHVHRVYVVDGDDHPSNVISMTTVMNVFSTPAENVFLTGKIRGSPIPTTM